MASTAVIILPSRIISRARPRPTSRERRWVPPKPGISPRPVSGSPNLALSLAYRKVQAMANSHPPPRANPLTAAMTGLPRFSIRFIRPCPRVARRSLSVAFMAAISPMSAPATKAFSPAPVKITTRTDSSAPKSAKQASNSPIVAPLRAFILSGRLTVTVAMPSATSHKIFV